MPWYRFGSRRTQERERAEEMRAHIDLYAEELVARGRSAGDAQREARLKFGNPRVKLEEVDALNRIPVLETLARDLRTAFVSLRGAPAFTAVALVVLTLAMGATTAVFSVVDAVVLRGLPFDEADRLVALDRADAGKVVMSPFTAPVFLALRDRQDVFDGLAAVSGASVTLGREGGNDPEILRAQRVSAEFFSVLRVAPAIGGAFTREHEVDGRERVAVLSHGFWQRRFGGSPDVLGKRLPAAGGDIEILGVMPAGFAYPVGALQPTDLWMPYVVPAGERGAHFAAYLRMVGRLPAGLTIETAQARIDDTPPANIPAGIRAGQEWRPALRDLRESLTGYTRPWLLMLLASVTCLLLIACVNIANLLLVRSTVRIRELSVRSALGATRWDLARMLLAESLVLATAGTALGTLLAWWGIEALRTLLPPTLPRLADIAIDWRVLAVSAAAALVTGIVFGLAPVFSSARAVDQVLKEHGRAEATSGRRQWLRATFVVAEVALAVVLLVGAALFLTSFARLMRVDLGVDYRNVLLVDVRPRSAGAEARQANAVRLAGVLERLQGIAGVETASMASSNLPFTGSVASGPMSIPGRTAPMAPGNHTISEISADYFRALRVPVLAGRSFAGTDSQSSDLVVIISEAVARTYFPGENPVGRIVSAYGLRTIVGVVGDVRSLGPEQEIPFAFFVPIAPGSVSSGTLVLKIAGNAAAVVPQVKAAIWSEFPDLALPPVRTLEERLGAYIAERRFSMLLLSLFGILGVAIASAGIYGVMTYVVAQRTREIGIRMALGAQPSTILWSVLRRASTQAALGLVVGLGIAWLLATSVKTFLFGIEPRDLRLYAEVCAVLFAMAVVAAFFPARRAARVDPVAALRSE